MVEPLDHVVHRVYFHLAENHVVAFSFVIVPLNPNDSKQIYILQITNVKKTKQKLIYHLPVVHHKIALEVDIYAVPTEVVLDVKEA